MCSELPSNVSTMSGTLFILYVKNQFIPAILFIIHLDRGDSDLTNRVRERKRMRVRERDRERKIGRKRIRERQREKERGREKET